MPYDGTPSSDDGPRYFAAEPSNCHSPDTAAQRTSSAVKDEAPGRPLFSVSHPATRIAGWSVVRRFSGHTRTERGSLGRIVVSRTYTLGPLSSLPKDICACVAWPLRSSSSSGRVWHMLPRFL